MTIQEFIKKWNVAFEDKELELEFANQMQADLNAVIAAQSQWVRVSECKPKIIYNKPQQYIVYTGNKKGSVVAFAVYLNGKFYNAEEYQSEEARNDIRCIEITDLVSHYTPLPTPPQD